MEYILKTDLLEKQYRNFKALKGISMNVPKGAVYGFVGKNGAGKTTLIRTICGLQKPTNGSYKLFGVKNTDSEIDNVRKRMGAIIESPSLYMNMSASDNMKQRCRSLGITFDNISDILKFVGLGDTKKKEVRNFSLGMRQRMGIAMTLCGNPEFLILDEPINGLDPQGIIEMRNLIQQLNQEQNITILISSHILDELSKIATHYGFIDNGSVVKELSADEVDSCCQSYTKVSVSDPTVLKAYLDSNRMKYRFVSDNEAHILEQFDISTFAVELYKKYCKIISISEEAGSLESFFISLVGGSEK